MERVAVQMAGRWQLAMIIAAILPLLDSSIINVILPDIAQSLPGELATMPWLVTLYLIASAAGVLLSGYLTARWGFRCVWRASLTVFAAASVVLALASRFDVMLLGRVLLGVAAAALLLLGLALWLNQIMTEPLFTLALFRHAHYAALMGLGVLTALLFYGFLIYYPLASVSQGDFPVWYLGAMLALQGGESGIGRRRLASWSDFGVMALGLALSLMSLVLIWPGHAG
ncbi:MFS transporter [Edwardsiella tarda]